MLQMRLELPQQRIDGEADFSWAIRTRL